MRTTAPPPWLNVKISFPAGISYFTSWWLFDDSAHYSTTGNYSWRQSQKNSELSRYSTLAVVVAQLVEQSLPTPEILALNPSISKLYLPIVH